MGKRFSKRAVILAVIAIFLISFFVPNIKFFKDAKEIDRNKLQENLKLINQECNSVYKDIEGSEKKYKDLLENTEDYFKSGMYCSCLVQVYTVKNDYKNVMYYAKEAIEYYRKVQGGEYYAIAENKYLAWIMLKIGSYSDTFSVTNALFEMLNSTAKEFLTEEEIIDKQA